MIGHFNQHEKFILTIAPEGTRRRVKEWKVGFLHIAHGAKVDVLPVGLDYPNKKAVIGDMITMNGDVEADLKAVKDFYLNVRGKYH